MEVTATLGRAYLQNGRGHRLLKIALYGELSTGHRDRVAPKKRFKDSLKKTLGTCHNDHHKWSTLAADSLSYRCIVHEVVPPLRTPRELISRKKAAGGGSKEPQQPYQTRPLTIVAEAETACPASA